MSREQIKALPLRGLVAFVTRCAQRLRPALEFEPEGPVFPEPPLPGGAWRERFEADSAIRVGCLFANGTPVSEETAVDVARSLGKTAGWPYIHLGSDFRLAVWPPRLDVPGAAALAALMAALATYHAVRAVIASSPPKETEAARQIADGCYARFAEVGDVGLSRLVQRPALQPEMRDAMDSDIRRLFEQTTAESGAIGPPIDVSSRGPLNGYWVAGTPEWYVAGRQLIEARRESLAQARSQLVAGARDLDEDDREALRQLCEGLGHSWSVSNDDWEDLSVASLALRWEMIWRLRPDFPEEIQPHNPFLLLGDAARFFPEEGNSEAVALVASALRFDVTDPLPLEPMLQEYRRAVLAHQKYLDEPTPPKRVSMRDSRIEDGAERISRILLRGELEPSLTVLKTYIALTQQSIPVEASPAARAVSLARLFSDDLAPLLALTYWRLRTERLDALLELIEASANQAELPGRALRQILESKQGRRDVLVEVFLGVAKEAAKMRATIASGLPERLQS